MSTDRDRNSVVIKLPKIREDGSNQASIYELARVYIHEVGHNLNLRHKEMMKWWLIPIDFLEEGEVDFKPIVLKPKKEVVKKSVVEIREEKARKKLAEWEKKMNRAKTFVKKYKQKVKYYDKKKERVTV